MTNQTRSLLIEVKKNLHELVLPRMYQAYCLTYDDKDLELKRTIAAIHTATTELKGRLEEIIDDVPWITGRPIQFPRRHSESHSPNSPCHPGCSGWTDTAS